MNRSTRVIVVLLSLAAIAYLVMAVSARPQPQHEFFEGLETPLVFAHQGGDYLWPSNTLYAFERAHDLGVDVLELDLHAAAGGTLVVIHDDTVDRTTDGSGAVSGFSVGELQELDAGYRWSPQRSGESFPYRGMGISIPTLEEVFDAFPDTRLNLEIKQLEPSIVGTLCDSIRRRGRESSVLVGSFHDSALDDFRKECPGVATSAGPGEVRVAYVLGRAFLGRLYRPTAQALQVPEYQGSLHVVTPSLIGTAQRKGVQVHVWTPNEVDEMERLLELGVDGIITDRPDRLLRILDRGGEVELPEGVPR